MSDWTNATTIPPVIREVTIDSYDEDGNRTRERVPLRAKYRGKCITCEGTIWPGDRILYDPTARKAMHANTVRDCIVNYLPADDDSFTLNDEAPVEILIPPAVGIGPPQMRLGYTPVKMSGVDPLSDEDIAEITGRKDWASYSDSLDDRVVEGPTLDDRARYFHDATKSTNPGGDWSLESWVETLDSPDAERANDPAERARRERLEKHG
jgi:hypothetical protein